MCDGCFTPVTRIGSVVTWKSEKLSTDAFEQVLQVSGWEVSSANGTTEESILLGQILPLGKGRIHHR